MVIEVSQKILFSSKFDLQKLLVAAQPLTYHSL